MRSRSSRRCCPCTTRSSASAATRPSSRARARLSAGWSSCSSKSSAAHERGATIDARGATTASSTARRRRAAPVRILVVDDEPVGPRSDGRDPAPKRIRAARRADSPPGARPARRGALRPRRQRRGDAGDDRRRVPLRAPPAPAGPAGDPDDGRLEEPERTTKAVELGAAGLLYKPFSHAELNEAVATALEATRRGAARRSGRTAARPRPRRRPTRRRSRPRPACRARRSPSGR